MVYNVENLFDDVHDGTEYAEYDPRGGKWTTELFRSRLNAITDVVRRAVPGGPDILALQEIENENALRALAASLGYNTTVMGPKQGAAVHTGLLTRLPVSRVRAHEVGGADPGERDIVEAEIGLEGRTLSILVNHWKSKSEGARRTEGSRVKAAGVVAARVRALLTVDPAADVLVVGDMNESSDEYARVGGAYRTALLPLGGGFTGEWEEDGLFLAPAPAEAGIHGRRLALYDPWEEIPPGGRGSYFYGGGWETVDHILMSGGLFDQAGFVYRKETFRAYREAFLLLPSGAPMSWERNRGQKGYSDHLPLLVTLDLRT